MRDTLTAMGQALKARQAEAYLGLSETLLMLMRQHNMKEENILYPMLDQALAAEAQTLLASQV
jgi:iron-sulfur cluster repair protein YtfE (RIC family)